MKKLIGFLLTVILLFTMLSSFMITANAEEPDYLCLTSTGDTKIAFANFPSSTEYKLEYYVNDGEWRQADKNTEITLGKYDSVYFRANGEQKNVTYLDNLQFKMTGTGTIFSRGTVMSLLKENKCFDYCFANLFENCTILTTAPKLPATALAKECYFFMFSNCAALTDPPSLPAVILEDRCYFGMFYGCTALTTAPELQAINLADGCYGSMFSNCTALINPPELPAATLAHLCYESMFSGCTALKTVPKLSATTLAGGCYSGMFYGCTALKITAEKPKNSQYREIYIPEIADCKHMFFGVQNAPTLESGKTYYCSNGVSVTDDNANTPASGFTLSNGNLAIIVGAICLVLGIGCGFLIGRKNKATTANNEE